MSAPLLLAIDHNGDFPILTGSVKKHRQYIDARSENNIYCVNFYRLHHKYRSYRLLAIGDLSITDGIARLTMMFCGKEPLGHL